MLAAADGIDYLRWFNGDDGSGLVSASNQLMAVILVLDL